MKIVYGILLLILLCASCGDPAPSGTGQVPDESRPTLNASTSPDQVLRPTPVPIPSLTPNTAKPRIPITPELQALLDTHPGIQESNDTTEVYNYNEYSYAKNNPVNPTLKKLGVYLQQALGDRTDFGEFLTNEGGFSSGNFALTIFDHTVTTHWPDLVYQMTYQSKNSEPHMVLVVLDSKNRIVPITLLDKSDVEIQQAMKYVLRYPRIDNMTMQEAGKEEQPMKSPLEFSFTQYPKNADWQLFQFIKQFLLNAK